MGFLYEAVAQQIADQIQRGIYRPGERLPGVRRLASQLGVSIATVIAAHNHLEDKRLIEGRSRSGFYVRAVPRSPLAEPAPSNPSGAPTLVTGQALVLRLVQAANDPAVVQLGAAVPDPAFLPTAAVERALCAVARQHRRRNAGYEFPPGSPELRRQIARRMAEWGAVVAPEEIVITDGCQEAITLALRAVARPGDVVAIESPTFYGLLQVIESLGLKALEIPTHPREGLSLEALQLALEQWPIKACVVVPNFSNPLGYCMPQGRKRALVELLARHGVALIEDDVYGDLGFSLERPPGLKAWDREGNVLYCASFSKTLSPGLRVGWIAPGRHMASVEYLKYVSNLAAPTASQLAVAALLERQHYDRHLRRMRADHARAVQRMSEAVVRHFPRETRMTQPEGGFVIWVELPQTADAFALHRKAAAEGVSLAPGPIFSATQKYRNFIRLNCACPWSERIEQAVAKLGRLL